MRIFIEYYKFGTIIEGKECSLKELKKMFKQAIKLRNNNYDGFAELFCTLFGYKTIEVIPLEGTIKDIMNSKFILDIDTDTVFTLEY